jgi:hypothetical protein
MREHGAARCYLMLSSTVNVQIALYEACDDRVLGYDGVEWKE